MVRLKNYTFHKSTSEFCFFFFFLRVECGRVLKFKPKEPVTCTLTGQRSASQDGCLILCSTNLLQSRLYSLIFSIMGPKRKPPMASDAIDPTDSTFEDHWDKLEIKLNEWVKSSLPGLVTSIMQSS